MGEFKDPRVMNWSYLLSAEERHLAKVGDLAALEQIALAAGEEYDIAAAYERIFEALDHRTKTDGETVLDWGQRYIAWANRFSERDGLPILRTRWARRLFERSMSAGRPDIARSVADAILRAARKGRALVDETALCFNAPVNAPDLDRWSEHTSRRSVLVHLGVSRSP